MRKWIYLGCLAAMTGVMVWMNVVTLPLITAEAQGLKPFDLRGWGYSEAEARAYLAALSPLGRATYLGLQHRLDTAFPLLLGVVLVWTFVAQLPRRWAVAASLFAVLGVAADLRENALVAGLLTADPTEGEIAAASLTTMVKTGTVSVALVALAYALLRAAWVWWRAR